jgi:3-demethoxyubiquinol 3-hydroxylase
MRHPFALRCLVPSARSFVTAASRPSAVYTDPSRHHDPAVATTPADISQKQHSILDAALRVDQAGEIAANWIYRGQMAVLGRDRTTGPIIQVCQFSLCFTGCL